MSAVAPSAREDALQARKGRVRWHCRRALLELDLVLERFVERHLEVFDTTQLADLEDLLRCEDHELWAMVNGSVECPEPRWRDTVALLRQC